MNSLLTDKEYIKTIFAQISGVSPDSVVIEPYAIMQPWELGAETPGFVFPSSNPDAPVLPVLSDNVIRAFDKLDVNCCYVPLFLKSRYSVDKVLGEEGVHEGWPISPVKFFDCCRFVDYFDTFDYEHFNLRVTSNQDDCAFPVLDYKVSLTGSGNYYDMFSSDGSVMVQCLANPSRSSLVRPVASLCTGITCYNLCFIKDVLFNACCSYPDEDSVPVLGPVGYQNFFYGWRLSLR